jgi:hypothetical protein
MNNAQKIAKEIISKDMEKLNSFIENMFFPPSTYHRKETREYIIITLHEGLPVHVNEINLAIKEGLEQVVADKGLFFYFKK